MSNAHALVSPSGAKKWMACPGSLAMEAGEPNTSSEYSDEGTAAHWLAATCLTEKKPPGAYKGRIIRVVDGVVNMDDSLPEDAKVIRDFKVNDDMIEHVGRYVTEVLNATVDCELLVEQRVPIGHITGEEDAEGTADLVAISKGGELCVRDLKYGMGVAVSAHENPQGILYILGAVELYESAYGPFTGYRFAIHQPRLDSLTEWTCTPEELQAWREKLSKAAKIALDLHAEGIGEIIHEALTPGQHCKDCFCRARAKCPTLAQFVKDQLSADFDDLDAVPPPPTGLKELGVKLKALDIIQDWCKAVRAAGEKALIDAKNSAEAIAALGYKLVAGKKGSRAWSSEEEAEARMKAMRMKSDVMYTQKVITPTAAEKVLKEHPKQWKKLQALVTQSEGGISVAPADDKRPAYVLPAPDAADFENLDDGSDLV